MAQSYLEAIQYRYVQNLLFSGVSARQAVDFPGQSTMSSQRSAVQIHHAQHAVLTLRLTHKHWFGILRPAKSKFLSLGLPF